MIAFNAVPAYEIAISTMMLAEIPSVDHKESAAAGAGAPYCVTSMALLVCPKAAPTEASPR
jgi:hypothetical protein